MKIRNLIFAAASAALVATPIAAQANTRAAQSSVAVTPSAVGTTRGSSMIDGEKFVAIGGILYAIIGGMLVAVWAVTEIADDNRSPGA